jgi:hypothetical protein
VGATGSPRGLRLPSRPAAIGRWRIAAPLGFLRFFCMRTSSAERGLPTPIRGRLRPAAMACRVRSTKRVPAASSPAQECATVAHRCVMADAKMRHPVHLAPEARAASAAQEHRSSLRAASLFDKPGRIAWCRNLVHYLGRRPNGRHPDGRCAARSCVPAGHDRDLALELHGGLVSTSRCTRRRRLRCCRSGGSRHRWRGTAPPSRSPPASRPSSSAYARARAWPSRRPPCRTA